MKRILNILVLGIESLFLYLVITDKITSVCLFKNLFGIRCPGCGLTRSFKAILNLDLMQAFHYNFLGPILFILCIIFTIFLIKDTILNQDKTLKLIFKILTKYYILILLIVFITIILNNINGI